jgi:hypothetical protein
MEISLVPSQPAVEIGSQSRSRRNSVRFVFRKRADWDFFSGATGAKSGYLENVSQGGCLIRTTEPIEFRRWIRLAIRDEQTQVYFTAVGRIARREDKLEAWDDEVVTLHRYGIEFIHALNPLILDCIRGLNGNCAICGDANGSIPDAQVPDRLYCVLCHLRKACHNLLVQEGLDTSA